MKVNIQALLKENGSAMSIHFNGTNQELEDHRFEEVELNEFEIKGMLTNLSETVKFSGVLNFSYGKNCDRCLKIATKKIHQSLEECFYSEFSSSSDAEYFFTNKTLDFTKFVTDQCIVLLPTKHICDENCQGICLHCGIDLNHSKCKCEIHPIDPRFKKLEDLMKHKEDRKIKNFNDRE